MPIVNLSLLVGEELSISYSWITLFLFTNPSYGIELPNVLLWLNRSNASLISTSNQGVHNWTPISCSFFQSTKKSVFGSANSDMDFTRSLSASEKKTI